MLRKKNYKQQEHFTQLHNFTIYAPSTSTQGPRKFQLYYKRYRKQQQSQNLYNLLNNSSKKQEEQIVDVDITKKFSQDRTLQLISFDGEIGFVKKYLRKIGKIRFFETGQGLYKGKKIYTAMCTFKFQFDLVKCFRQDYLQTKIDEACLENARAITQQDRQEQRHKLIQEHMGKQLNQKLQKLKEMQADGFQVVTDIYGQYRLDVQGNKKFVQDLPQIKRKKKKLQKQRRLQEQLAKQE